jgi:hypothetical protein
MHKKRACRPKPLNGRMQRGSLSVSKHAFDGEVSYIPLALVNDGGGARGGVGAGCCKRSDR